MTGDFFLTQWFFLGMRWLYENAFTNNIFLTILVSTIILRLLTLFSDIKQRKTSLKMAAIQPQVQDLQQRYKNDPQKLQAEQQKLMKENKVGMFSGCLPLLITLPLLFCFIAAFRFWGYEQNVQIIAEMNANVHYAAENGTEVEISETFSESKFLWINNIWQPDNGMSPVVVPAETFYSSTVYKSTKKLIYFDENPELYQEFIDMGIFYDEKEGYDKLSDEQKDTLKTRAVEKYNDLMEPLTKVYEGKNNGWFILPVFATLFQFVYALYSMKTQQSKQRKKNENQPDAAPAPGANTAKYMTYLMPIMSFFFCLSATSAFAIYWTLSSATMLLINIILNAIFKAQEKNAVK